MLTRILSVSLWKAAVLMVAAFLVGAAAGALYVSGRKSGEQTAAKTVEKVADKAIAVTDTARVKQLRQQLATAKSETAAFQSQLAEAARANPAPTACRLPDGLRDNLNR
jgi:type IV secretory pathway VirB6-like protein